MAAVDYDRLAALYDSLVTESPDVPFFLEQARRAGGPVLDVMAGTGRVSMPLLEAGADLTCVDGSQAMLDVLANKLRERGIEATLLHQDAARLDAGRKFRLAFIAFNSFEELTGDGERRRTLRGILDHLVPGGRFICTLHDPARRLESAGPGRDLRRAFHLAETGEEMELTLATRVDPGGRIVEGTEVFRKLDSGEIVLELPLRFRLCGADEFLYDLDPSTPGGSDRRLHVHAHQEAPFMKYGARNEILATVKSVKKGDVMSLVKFDVTVPCAMASVLTTESAEHLELQPGDQVRLVVKAIHVLPVKE